jgi:hypothetical protein
MPSIRRSVICPSRSNARDAASRRLRGVAITGKGDTENIPAPTGWEPTATYVNPNDQVSVVLAKRRGRW